MEVITILEKLETFKIVYETQNFSKAAELLFVSQPTVSAHIKQLEEELNTQLFIRNGRMNIAATPQAHLLYQRSLNLLDDWQHLYQEIQQGTQQLIPCRIGVSHTFAIYLLPDLLIGLYARFPHIQFQVEMINSAAVLHAVEQHELDLGIIEKPLSASTVERYPLMSDRLVLAGNPVAGPWLVREQSSGVYYYMKRYLEEQNIQTPVLEIANNEMIVALLKKGFGSSIISVRATGEIPYKELGEQYQRQFYLIKRPRDSYKELTACASFIRDWQEDPE
jgi:DNA-binding transcriptional LysR family regulator